MVFFVRFFVVCCFFISVCDCISVSAVDNRVDQKSDNGKLSITGGHEGASKAKVQYGGRFRQKKSAREAYFSPHDLCENEIIVAEKKHNIPRKLLMAIGTVESGRAADSSKQKRPWPWTICAEGKSYYCSTKSAAIAIVKRIMARGVRNIDVGCMQVNLLHHSKAFKNLEEAFTPKNNVAYAANFFAELRKDAKSWTHAVGYYHSRASKYYKPYCNLVYDAWKKVQDNKVNNSPKVCKAAAEVKSSISYIPSYYSLADKEMTSKLHKLGKQSISRTVPKFFFTKAK
ncbi:hypothetical protein FACS1894122_03060 [Alphaproteobacteria bacterium]|nr:hypothetical protein FACS1894122_03010 [Alphaproteobacteria bacterium]GHT91164.1 hypothetical protein FACS1894122_03060 [Alphaproteobacteria bacterium]